MSNIAFGELHHGILKGVRTGQNYTTKSGQLATRFYLGLDIPFQDGYGQEKNRLLEFEIFSDELTRVQTDAQKLLGKRVIINPFIRTVNKNGNRYEFKCIGRETQIIEA